jgi:GNAT superfamily N-acetyltransferase
MNDIEFSLLRATDTAQVDAAFAVVDRALTHDLPDFPKMNKTTFVVGLLRPNLSNLRHHVLAEQDGQVLAVAELDLPQKENLHLAEVEINVDPQHRRRGVGSALRAEIERRITADGRNTLVTYVVDDLPGESKRPKAGQRFAEGAGFVNSQFEVHRKADLAVADESQLDAFLADCWAKADGYELVQWVRSAPEELIDDVAYLESRLLQDAPLGDLDMEPQKIDAARARDSEATSIDRGQLGVHTGMRHRDSGRLVGWTEIVVNPADETDCWQGITLVDPDHRGHRLGTILKIANHRHVKQYRPQMRYVHTWNAEANDFMININEAIGYRAVERWIAYQKKLS